MADVIAAHQVTESGLTEDCDVYWLCSCGRRWVTADTQVRDQIYSHANHLADELTKAGFGLLPNAMHEYGAPLRGLNGPSGPPVEHGYIRDPNFLTKSTHHRLVTPWQELTQETP